MSAVANSRTAAPIARGINASRLDLLLVLPFIVFFLVQLVHHEMWRDELNAWGIVVASHNPISLYQHIRYEGHPSLWYIVLWFPARFTSSPVAMQCVQALIGIGIYLMIAVKSPFSRLEEVLLYTSYFISFEYTVMSRMYGLCLLLALIYAHRRSRYPHQVLQNVALLALMANTDVMGTILSGALFVEYTLANYRLWQQGDLKRATLLRGTLIYVTGIAFTLLALRISPNISWRTTGRILSSARDPRHFGQAIINYVAVPWIPISDQFPQRFWNPWINTADHPEVVVFALLVILIYGWIFRRDAQLALIVLLTAAVAIVFGHFIYMGSTRHFGITFMALLAALWMQRYRRPQFSILVLGLLFVSSVSGVKAAIAQWNHPFSQSRNAIHFLKSHGLENAVLIGTKDTSVAGIAEQLQRSIYFLDCNCADTYLLFSNRRDDYNPDSIPGRIALASSRLNARDMIFLATDPLPTQHLQRLKELGFNIELLASFTGAEDWEENYFIYQVRVQ